MKTLVTGRLLLRPWTLDDASDLLEITGDPEVAPLAGCALHQSVSDAEGMIRSMLERGGAYAIICKEDGRLIGQIGIMADTLRSPQCDSRAVGYMLNRAYWGKGYMPEAMNEILRYLFEDVGVNRVSVSHFNGNGNSCRVIEKCGFTYEGTFRRSMFRKQDGAILDESVYSMSRREYEQRTEERQ